MFVSTMSVFAEADGPGIDEEAPLVTLDDPTTEEGHRRDVRRSEGALRAVERWWHQVRRMHRFRRSMHAIRASGRSDSGRRRHDWHLQQRDTHRAAQAWVIYSTSRVSAVGPQGTTLSWVDPEWLRERGETYQSLPLWTGGTMEWTLVADPTSTDVRHTRRQGRRGSGGRWSHLRPPLLPLS